MRVRVLGSLAVCLLTVYGCGGSSGPSNTDAGDASSDRADTAGSDRPDTGTDKGSAVDTGTDAPKDVGPDASGDASNDTRTDGGGDASEGGIDGAVPTCSDGIKNSDETGIDCGGHCGKCGAGQPCVMATDCQFGICKADGTCGACSAATDCGGAETECQHRTCTAGVCGDARSAAGTVLTVQTVGDCKQRQCAADGTVAVVNDGSDLPDDKNPCTNDICTAGTPSHTLMPVNTNCGGANTCNASGQCIGCTVGTDCPGTDNA
jgi:hypothetical protein